MKYRHTSTQIVGFESLASYSDRFTSWQSAPRHSLKKRLVDFRVLLHVLAKTEISAPGRTGIPLFTQYSTTTLSYQRLYVQSMKYCRGFCYKNYFVLLGLYKYNVITFEIKVKTKMCCKIIWIHNI